MVLKREITFQINDILKKNPQGMSITEIVKAVSINRNTAGRYLENLLVSGQLEMRRFGMAKIYMLSQRVPFSAVLSISSELVIQLDGNLRIIFTNEPFLDLIGADEKDILGKNIEYTSVATVFEDTFPFFIGKIQEGLNGKEWSGEVALSARDILFSCRIAPTVFDDGHKGVSVILEDITSRKKAEQQMEESERQFRLLAENSLDMIGRIRPDFTHLYVSPAYKTTLGFLPEEIIGKRWEGFIHPEDFPIMESVGTALTHQNSSATIRVRAKHKDGHYIWIESRVRAIFDEKTGELSEYYVVTRDITERKRIEEVLRESEATARALINAPTDSVILLDPLGIILALNETAAGRFGKRSDEVVGILVDDLLPKEVARSRRLLISQVLEKKKMVRFEDKRDGKWYDTVAYPITSGAGEVIKIAIIARDITERKKAEKALIQSEQRYRQLVDISPDAVLLHMEGKIVFINPAALNLLGASHSAEIIGKKVLDFIQPEFRAAVMKNIEKDLGGEITPSMELHMLRVDGTSVIVEGRGVRTFIDGKPAIQVAIRELHCARIGRNSIQRRG